MKSTTKVSLPDWLLPRSTRTAPTSVNQGNDGEKYMTEKENEEAKDVSLHQNKTKHSVKLCIRHETYIGTWNV